MCRISFIMGCCHNHLFFLCFFLGEGRADGKPFLGDEISLLLHALQDNFCSQKLTISKIFSVHNVCCLLVLMLITN